MLSLYTEPNLLFILANGSLQHRLGADTQIGAEAKT